MNIRKILSIFLKIIGVVFGLYISVWCLLIVPIREIITEYQNHTLFLGMVVTNMIKIIISLPIFTMLIGCWITLSEEIEGNEL